MKLFFKVLLGLFLFGIIGFGLYAYKYHSLAMEGWRLFNERCNNVNPLLIKTRNIHLALGAATSGKASPSAEQFENDLISLPKYADQYLSLERVWLDKQGAYLNRWDFNLFEPEYLKIAGKYQLAMYQAYYNYYKTLSSFFNNAFEAKATGNESKNNGNIVELMDEYSNEIRTNRDLYNQAFDKGAEIKDWRKKLAQVPEPDCFLENLIIPEYYLPSPTPIPYQIEQYESQLHGLAL